MPSSSFQFDATTCEFSWVIIRMAKGLSYSLHSFGRKPAYVLEDQLRGRFFRLGIPEYTLISLFDGKLTLGEAIARTTVLLGSDAFSEEHAATFCAWLVENGLAETEASLSTDRQLRTAEKATRARWLQKINPVSFRLEIGSPESLLSALTPLLSIVFSPAGFVCWLFLLSWGIYAALSNWTKLTSSTLNLFDASNWVFLGLTSFSLKLLHELSHGIACHRFGGRVTHCGLQFLLFFPLPYVDVTSCWRFIHKSSRIMTSAAGVYAELFCAAVAAIVFANSDSIVIQKHALNIIVTASATTLLFNINPLMRFDGYYILSDLLEIPNLSSQGRQFIRGAAKRLFFGITPPPTANPLSTRSLISAYGSAAFFWSILVSIGIILTAANIFHGFGLLLAVIALFFWYGLPLVATLRSLLSSAHLPRTALVRCTLVTASFLILSVIAFHAIPAPATATAPILIEHDPYHLVRAASPGFVEEIFVQSGIPVSEGQPLLLLRNEQLQIDLVSLQSDRRQTEIRLQAFKISGNVPAALVEEKNLAAINQRIPEVLESIESLTVTSPISGYVIADSLELLRETYIQVGQPILAVGGKQLCAIALVSQRDSIHIAHSASAPFTVELFGRRGQPLSAQLLRINPRASTLLPHPAFGANAGGPLPVVQDQSTSQIRWYLEDPRVELALALPDSVTPDLRSGETGLMFVRARDSSLGDYLLDHAQDWFRRKIRLTHGL